MRVLREQANASRALTALTIDDVRQMMLDFGAGPAEMEPDRLRVFLRGLVDRVELDAESGNCRIICRLPAEPGKLLASPTRFELVFAP